MAQEPYFERRGDRSPLQFKQMMEVQTAFPKEFDALVESSRQLVLAAACNGGRPDPKIGTQVAKLSNDLADKADSYINRKDVFGKNSSTNPIRVVIDGEMVVHFAQSQGEEKARGRDSNYQLQDVQCPATPKAAKQEINGRDATRGGR